MNGNEKWRHDLELSVTTPWELTQLEYCDLAVSMGVCINGYDRRKWRKAQKEHRQYVVQALKENKVVSTKVLADYPDLDLKVS